MVSENRAIKIVTCQECPIKFACRLFLVAPDWTIAPNCPLPKWPSLDKKQIIQIQNILLAVAEKETGVIIAMAKIDGILHEIGVVVESVFKEVSGD
jgi:hypothetical protein